MKKKILFSFLLGFSLLLPSLTSAECTNIGGFSSFSLEGANTVVLYSVSGPVARFDVMSCEVQPSSKIRLIKSDVCDGDDIMIDGERCRILEIKPLGP